MRKINALSEICLDSEKQILYVYKNLNLSSFTAT
jgi:hypothetical protein